MKIKLISTLMSLVMLISSLPQIGFAAGGSVSSSIFHDDFESGYTSGTFPEEDKNEPYEFKRYGNKDAITVEKVGTSNRLKFGNTDDTMTSGIERAFEPVTDKTVALRLEFLQIGQKSDKNVIAALYSDDTEALSVQTLGGNIILKGKDSDNVLIENYFANKNYKIEILVDLFNKTATVTIDDEQIGEYPLSTDANYVNKFKAQAEYSPGFCLDNISLSVDADAESIEIKGDEKPVIPKYDYVEYEYKATVKDSNGVAISGIAVEWTADELPAGVELTDTNKSTTKLKVDSTAAEEKSFVLIASIPDTDIKKSITVTTTPLKATNATIEGWQIATDYYDSYGNVEKLWSPTFSVTSGLGQNVFDFDVTVTDQFGNDVGNYGQFKWELFKNGNDEVPANVTIDASTGEVTVTGTITEESRIGIRVTAVADSAITAERTLLVSDYDTFIGDKDRFDAVLCHIERAMRYGSDDDSPLISDILTRTEIPGIASLPSKDGDMLTSNVMSESSLMRAMVNLSQFTGDSKYEDRVNDIYSFMLSNGVINNTLSWGGHASMDMSANAPYNPTYNKNTHEIKGPIPYMSPLFNDEVNVPYSGDYDDDGNEINGNGMAGFLARTIIAGHSGNNLQQLAFERHYSTTHKASMESVWQTPEVFDSEREGPIVWRGGASFLIVSGGMISVLLDYYNSTGDTNALLWAENCMRSVMNSSYTYYVKDGKPYFPDMEHDLDTDTNENGVIDDDEERLPLSQEYMERHNITTWTEGIFNETFTTTHGAEDTLYALDASDPKPWYDRSNKDDYTGPQYGDRFWTNVMYESPYHEDDNWYTMGYCTEEEGRQMLDPYTAMRENSCITNCGYAFTDVIDTFRELGNTDTASELALQYSKAIYNYLKLRYNWNEHTFDSYMTWKRPDAVRQSGQTEYIELGEDENLNKSEYFRTNKPSPHNGYYYSKGTVWAAKSPEIELIPTIAQIINSTIKTADSIKATDAEDAELLYKRARYLWKVLRDLCLNKFTLGDIGELETGDYYLANPEAGMKAFENIVPKLDMMTTASSEVVVEGFMELYRITGNDAYLEFCRRVANNNMQTYYNASEQTFTSGSALFTNSTVQQLPIFLELRAMIEDSFDENIKARAVMRGAVFFDNPTERMDGSYRANTSFMNIYSQPTVKVKEIYVDYDSITLAAGESQKLTYKVLPYDAANKTVVWEVYDKTIADVNQDTGEIYAKKPGITKMRGVSKGTLDVQTKDIIIVVE